MEPFISIVIATYNGAARILDTLSSLTRQTYSKFEVIVVVDGSQDDTMSTISGANLPLQLVVHEQINQGRAGARNTGLKLSSAEYIVFLDDDVLVPETLIEGYINRLREGHVIVAGSFYPVVKSHNEYTRYASYLNDKWSADLIATGGNLSRPYLPAGNALVRKSVFLQMNGFDGALRDAEDIDLAIRLMEAGFHIYYDPQLAVGHIVHATFRKHIERQLQYKEANKILLERNAAAAKYVVVNYKGRGYLNKLVYRLLSGGLFLTLIDTGAFRVFPPNARFRVYDIILTAYVMYHDQAD